MKKIISPQISPPQAESSGKCRVAKFSNEFDPERSEYSRIRVEFLIRSSI